LLISSPIGKLISLPDSKTCNIENLTIIPVASAGSIYYGYDVNIMNTAMRLVATSSDHETVSKSLDKGSEWYSDRLTIRYHNGVVFEPFPSLNSDVSDKLVKT
jgi:hypothetical protein